MAPSSCWCWEDDGDWSPQEKTKRLWVAGASQGTNWGGTDGGNERELHVAAIEAGAPGFVLFYKRTMTGGKEKITEVTEDLFEILRLEREDDGKVFAVCRRMRGAAA